VKDFCGFLRMNGSIYLETSRTDASKSNISWLPLLLKTMVHMFTQFSYSNVTKCFAECIRTCTCNRAPHVTGYSNYVLHKDVNSSYGAILFPVVKTNIINISSVKGKVVPVL
jgi:hypothetical protein